MASTKAFGFAFASRTGVGPSMCFGADVVAHYLHFLTTELRKFDEAVTCWERARSFARA